MKHFFISFLLILLLAESSTAAYVIKGRVNLDDDWQPKVFMAAVEKLSDYYRASAELVISVAKVNEDGYFRFEGNNLPEEDRFYRFYLMKEQNSDYDACLYIGGDDHNFIHLLLNNNSLIDIQADSSYSSPFGNYQIENSTQNESLRALARMVYPSFEFYKFRFPTELKLAEESMHENLKNFADTCQYPLVALAAVNNTDFDYFFESDKAFYLAFAERLKERIPYSPYTDNYIRKVRIYDEAEDRNIPWWIWTLLALGWGVAGLLAVQWWRFREMLSKQAPEAEASSKMDLLTEKELEILRLIAENKTNKEIAATLFISLSTVKSHLNKIYNKLRVNNRNQAAQVYQTHFQQL